MKYDISGPLKEIVKKSGMRVTAFARSQDLSETNFLRLVRGERSVTEKTVRALAEKLRIPVERLATIVKEPPKIKPGKAFGPIPKHLECGTKKALEIIGPNYLSGENIVITTVHTTTGARRIGAHGMNMDSCHGGGSL